MRINASTLGQAEGGNELENVGRRFGERYKWLGVVGRGGVEKFRKNLHLHENCFIRFEAGCIM